MRLRTISIIMEMSADISTIMEIYGILHSKERGGLSMSYKDAIIEIVGKIHNQDTLKRIYRYALYLYTHEAGGH